MMIRNSLFIAIILAVFAGSVAAQDKLNYRIYSADGKPVTYNEMLLAAGNARVVLFGELHNNALAHWLQFELTKDMFSKHGSYLVLGAEMLEADGQLLLDEYLAGFVSEKNFRDQARLWSNYATDYAPLVNFARDKGLKFIATNIPRHYASMVARDGFDALEKLSPEAKKLIAPLPVDYDETLPGYAAMMSMGGMSGKGGPPNTNLPKAQAIKDATMAHFIIKNMKPESVFLHFHGAYHSDNYEGIFWYLKKADKNLTTLTISTTEQSDIGTLSTESLGRADFIIVVDEDFTKTY